MIKNPESKGRIDIRPLSGIGRTGKSPHSEWIRVQWWPNSAIVEKYGSSPQLRVIFQPVDRSGVGKVKVHDVAAHLVYSFLQPTRGKMGKRIPDKVKFTAILDDLVKLKGPLEGEGHRHARQAAGRPSWTKAQ